jgi:hypothetical protein
MKTSRYQSIGSKVFSAGMLANTPSGTSKTPPADLSAGGDTWWRNWDGRWINHYDEEWMAFVSEHPKTTNRVPDEGVPCVWNLPNG